MPKIYNSSSLVASGTAPSPILISTTAYRAMPTSPTSFRIMPSVSANLYIGSAAMGAVGTNYIVCYLPPNTWTDIGLVDPTICYIRSATTTAGTYTIAEA